MEVRDGLEPSLRGLQPRALPLGYQTDDRADDGNRTRLSLPGEQTRHLAASSAKARPETRECMARRRGIEPR
jgi:hypothetical protein